MISKLTKIKKANLLIHIIDNGYKDLTIVGIEVKNCNEADRILLQLIKHVETVNHVKRYIKTLESLPARSIKRHDIIDTLQDMLKFEEKKI